jgi:hypothetical protein
MKTPHPDTAAVIAPPPVLLAVALAIGFCLQAIKPISFVSRRSFRRPTRLLPSVWPSGTAHARSLQSGPSWFAGKSTEDLKLQAVQHLGRPLSFHLTDGTR